MTGGSLLPAPGVQIKTYFFSSIDKVWTPGPDMLRARVTHSCGLLTSQNKTTCETERVVVVAGGFDPTSELLYLDRPYPGFDLQFLPGPPLPRPTGFGPPMVNFGSSLVFSTGTGLDNALYRLDGPQEPWIQMDQTLKVKRPTGYQAAFLVPNNFAICN